MELIKQIKDAENQAKEIVEKARKEAVALSEQARRGCDEQLRKAQAERQQAIDAAVKAAQEQAKGEVENLKMEGHSQIEAMRKAAADKMETCVAAIVARLEQA